MGLSCSHIRALSLFSNFSNSSNFICLICLVTLQPSATGGLNKTDKLKNAVTHPSYLSHN